MGSHTKAYIGTAVYKDGKLEFINHAERYIEKDGAGYKYVYRLTDHLGNTWVSLKDNNADGVIKQNEDEVIATTDYYPFGLEHRKSQISMKLSNLGKNLRYQGQERTFDLCLNIGDWGKQRYVKIWG